MSTINILELAAKLLAQAREQASGRQSETIFGGHQHDLRQTLICLTEGKSLGEHQSPGEATVQVIGGTIDITAGDDTARLHAGDFYLIPPLRHSVAAVSDASFLLTVATRGE
jgi:quercetin dioxygenase-like cupin family protein